MLDYSDFISISNVKYSLDISFCSFTNLTFLSCTYNCWSDASLFRTQLTASWAIVWSLWSAMSFNASMKFINGVRKGSFTYLILESSRWCLRQSFFHNMIHQVRFSAFSIFVSRNSRRGAGWFSKHHARNYSSTLDHGYLRYLASITRRFRTLLP